MTVSKEDIKIISSSLGRYPRGVDRVVYRCSCGVPVVVKVKSKLEDGTPFPTTFYLVDSFLIKEVSKLESVGFMKELNSLLENDKEFKKDYLKAHKDYIMQRDKNRPDEIKDISAGGMPNYIKCLHAHIAHTLGTKMRVNPVGNIVLEKLKLKECWH